MERILISILIGAVGWDVLTTYYGTIAIFVDSGFSRTPLQVIQSANIFQHAIGVVFAVFLATFILAYRAILDGGNPVTKPLLFIGFIYDFATSFFGTLKASGSDNGGAIAIVILLSLLASASPILITNIIDKQKADYD